MQYDLLWVALGLMLIFEGLYPFISPASWRRLFSQLLQLSDAQLRFFGATSIFIGLAVVWFLAP